MTALTKKSQSEFSDNFFELLKERSRDKTLSVRKEACFALSSLYKDSLESKCLSTAKSSSALNTILHLYYQNSLDDKFIVERLLKSSIVPYTSKNSARVQALIRCYSLMDEASIKAMQEIFKAQYANLNLLRDTVKLLEEHMRGEMSPEANTKIMSMIQILNGLIPKTEKSVEHLKRFFNQTHTDKDLRRLLKEILRKIGKTTGAVNTASDNQTNYSRVVKMLLERCAPVLFDKEFGKELMSQLMVDNQSSSAFGTTESISVARSLRLLLAVSVYFKVSSFIYVYINAYATDFKIEHELTSFRESLQNPGVTGHLLLHSSTLQQYPPMRQLEIEPGTFMLRGEPTDQSATKTGIRWFVNSNF
ncbi:unnamed protein product [Trichobilharzia regenti]|nr:unnamed protein product [Trichobilharzia regenti]